MDQKAQIYAKIYLVTQQIPAGQVASYGDVAKVVGGGIDGRTVGYALGEMGELASQVPWQRVVNREGGISTRGAEQRALLEQEGVAFDNQGRAIMARHRWPGPSTAWAEANGCQTLPPQEPPAEQLTLF
jgi:methylated-DNA-protein-cysteine methyltransferase related protein